MSQHKLYDRLYLELKQNTDEYRAVIDSLDNASCIYKPSAEKWSVYEVLEHITASESDILKVFLRKDSKYHLENSDAIYNIGKDVLYAALKDRSQKMESPGHVVPTGRYGSFDDCRLIFFDHRSHMLSLLAEGQILFNNDMHRHAVIGPMTRLDWFYFMLFHSARHLEQIYEIKASVIKAGVL